MSGTFVHTNDCGESLCCQADGLEAATHTATIFPRGAAQQWHCQQASHQLAWTGLTDVLKQTPGLGWQMFPHTSL